MTLRDVFAERREVDLETGYAQSREEIATNQTVLKTLLQKYPAQPRKEIALDRISAQTAKADWTSATSSSVKGGGRTGATKSRDGYTLRPDAGSTSLERLRKELRLPTGSGLFDGDIFFGMLSRRTERINTKSILPTSNNSKKNQRRKFPRNNLIYILWPRPGKAKS